MFGDIRCQMTVFFVLLGFVPGLEIWMKNLALLRAARLEYVAAPERVVYVEDDRRM